MYHTGIRFDDAQNIRRQEGISAAWPENSFRFDQKSKGHQDDLDALFRWAARFWPAYAAEALFISFHSLCSDFGDAIPFLVRLPGKYRLNRYAIPLIQK